MNINLISAIGSYLKNRKEKKAKKRKQLEKLWQDHLEKNATTFYDHGFNKIKFPIFLIEGEVKEETKDFEFDNYDFTVVEDLSEFAGTNYYHSASMENEFKLIDFNGEIWNFKYKDDIKVCTPGSLLKKIDIKEIKKFIVESIGGWKNEAKIKDAVERAASMPEIFDGISQNYST